MAALFTHRALQLIRRTRAAALLFPLLLAAGCATVPPPAGDPAVLPEPVRGEALLPAEARRYSVDTQASEVRLLVYRDGPLARFGHNHVIIGRVSGEVRAGDTAAASGFQLEIPVDSYVMDPPTPRAEEGDEFAAEVSEPARRATRENMLGKDGLEVAQHPLIRIASIRLIGPIWNPTVTARVTLHGVTRDLRFPVAVFLDGDTLTAVASFRIKQTDFDIKPFSALNGGLLTRDALDIRIRLVAPRE